MPSDKATQTQHDINDVEMPDVETPQPSHYNHTAAPTTIFFSFWRNPTTRFTVSHTPPPQQHLIQHFPSPALTCSTWNSNPHFRSPSPSSPRSPVEPLVPRGHGPCNRCGTCTSRHFYQSKWEPDHECCYECWEADRMRRADDTLEEWRGRYFLRGVGNEDVEKAMDVEVPPAQVEQVRVVSWGWGVEVTEEEAEARGEEMEVAARTKTSGIGVESPPGQVRDEVIGAAQTGTAVDAPLPAPPPSARFWNYKTEPAPEPGFKETPVEVLDKSTRSGKVNRRSH